MDLGTGAMLAFVANSALPTLPQFSVGVGASGTLKADGAGTVIDARVAPTSFGTQGNSSASVTLTNGAALLLGQNTNIGDAGRATLTAGSGSHVDANGTTVAFKLDIGNQATRQRTTERRWSRFEHRCALGHSVGRGRPPGLKASCR